MGRKDQTKGSRNNPTATGKRNQGGKQHIQDSRGRGGGGVGGDGGGAGILNTKNLKA